MKDDMNAVMLYKLLASNLISVFKICSLCVSAFARVFYDCENSTYVLQSQLILFYCYFHNIVDLIFYVVKLVRILVLIMYLFIVATII